MLWTVSLLMHRLSAMSLCNLYPLYDLQDHLHPFKLHPLTKSLHSQPLWTTHSQKVFLKRYVQFSGKLRLSSLKPVDFICCCRSCYVSEKIWIVFSVHKQPRLHQDNIPLQFNVIFRRSTNRWKFVTFLAHLSVKCSWELLWLFAVRHVSCIINILFKWHLIWNRLTNFDKISYK